jgi:hypothetical protein
MKLLNNLKQLNKVYFISMIAGFLTIAFILSITLTYAKDKNYQTRIRFDKENPNMLVLEDNQVELHPGLSKDQLNELNMAYDPEMIKVYMQEIANEYGVDWKLVYAIGYHESGNYNSALARSNNNFFGRKAKSGGYASWSTPEEGIRDQFGYLKERYFDRGLDTPAKINPVYAEDSGWHYKVESVMASLEA